MDVSAPDPNNVNEFVNKSVKLTVSPVMILQIKIRTFVINVIKAAWLGYDFVKENFTATVSSVMILQMKIRTFVINVINHKTATWPTPLLRQPLLAQI